MTVPFFELPSGSFPVKIEFFSVATRRVVWGTIIGGEGALRVPPLVREHGPVWVRTTFGDGQVIDYGPDGTVKKTATSRKVN